VAGAVAGGTDDAGLQWSTIGVQVWIDAMKACAEVRRAEALWTGPRSLVTARGP
jgi:hypothetical protein